MIPCLVLLLTGCATTPDEPVVVYRTVEVVRDRYVALPGHLVSPVEEVALPGIVDTIALGAAFKQCRIRVRQANGQLVEIGQINLEETQ